MEELFRFSVIRAATRSNVVAVSLERPPAPPPAPAPTPTPTTPRLQLSTRAAVRPSISGSLPAFMPSMAGLGLVGSPALPPQAPRSFQDQLRDVVHDLPGDPETIWKSFEPIALDFVLNQSHVILTDSLWMSLGDFLARMEQAFEKNATASSKFNSATVARWIEEQGGQSSLPGYGLDLSDLFIALLIIRRGGPSNLDTIIRSRKLWDVAELLSDNPTLQEIADRIRIIDLIKAGPAALAPQQEAKTTPADFQAAAQTALEKALNKTLLFPAAIFAPLRKPVHGVGFRELHVVKQHIRRYELTEVGRIENILKGESRDHSQKHTLSNERDTFFQTDTTTETDKELTSTDHVDIKNEAQNQVKEDTKVDAGVHAQYDSGSFKLQADVTVSYDKSTDETKKFSSDIAKDVTQKAVTKVTQRVTQSQTTKIIETWEEAEDQSFDNKTGQGHVSGVYQWVEKVYLAQVFNLGRHMLLDIMVPEPGASLLAAATSPPVDQKLPVPPDPLGSITIDAITKLPILNSEGHKQLNHPLTPDQLIDASTVSNWIAKFQVTGVEPSPPKYITVGKAIATKREDDIGQIVGEDVIRLEDGYAAAAINVIVTFLKYVPNVGGNEPVLDVTVGGRNFHFDNQRQHWGNDFEGSEHYDYPDPPDPKAEQGQIPVTIAAVWVEHAAVDIEVLCERTGERFAKWQLATYEKIAAAWQKLQADYESKVAGLQGQKETVGSLGGADREANRLIERIELKRSCIAYLDNNNVTVRGIGAGSSVAVQQFPTSKPDSKDPGYPQLPEPDLTVTQGIGARVRWFEQAFEWENIAYVSYPYFWGRRQTWIERLNLKNGDPLFVSFLQAGYARVVVPVRLGFEWGVHFYLHTGLPWLGGDLPSIGDKTQNPLYLDIAEEIKALTGGGESRETETPIGEPWEYHLPTTLIKVRKDDALPEWHRVGPTAKDDPNYPSDAPVGAWSWRDGQPKP
jgi:hypothetical protein